MIRERHAIKEKEYRKTEALADLARLRRQARQGDLKASAYEELKADDEAEMRELGESLRELNIQHAGTSNDTAVLECLEQVIIAVDAWDGLSPAERKEMLRALCERLTVLYKGRKQEIETCIGLVDLQNKTRGGMPPGGYTHDSPPQCR